MHASWVNRDATGLTLRESAEFDSSDSLLLHGELKRFEKCADITGQGPTIAQKKRRFNEREIEAANQSGADLVNFGVSEEECISSQVLLEATIDDGCQPPKKTKTTRKDPFKCRLDEASKGEMKIRSVSKVSALKKTFKVANSSKGKMNYTVDLTNTPSCTCIDFDKNKSKVLCKHIIFVVAVALDGMDLVNTLRTRYLGDDDIKVLISQPVPPHYLQKKEKKTR